MAWLLAVFSSETCESCAASWAKAQVVASDDVHVQDIPWQQRKDLHERYGVDTVPALLLVDADGVVRASFVGTPSATDLWAAVAEARDPDPARSPGSGGEPRLRLSPYSPISTVSSRARRVTLVLSAPPLDRGPRPSRA